MQNKKTKNQLRKNVRRMHERVGAVILIAGILVSIVSVSTEARRLLSALALRPVFAVIEHSGRENEAARYPVKLDDALRAPHISGY